MMASLGYLVFIFDGRGSNNRGLNFEGYLRDKMGQFEVSDTVQGMKYVMSGADKTLECNVDPKRIGIFGWSYGGYLSLMAMGQHSDFFKVAVSGAPVSMWELYDTGYTERYMDTPQNNPEGYKLGSVLHYVPKFPDEYVS